MVTLLTEFSALIVHFLDYYRRVNAGSQLVRALEFHGIRLSADDRLEIDAW